MHTIIALATAAALGLVAPEPGSVQEYPATPSLRLAEAATDARLAEILAQVLENNPELEVLLARTAAARQRPSQARALPDPQAELTTYLLSPETRVGPQRLAARVMQRFPWFGTLALREQAARFEAVAAEAELEARRVRLITTARKQWLELGFVDSAFDVLRLDRLTLERFEELARARYASGRGLQRDVISVQAEITRVDVRMTELAARRRSLVAQLNALRGVSDRDLQPVDLVRSGEVPPERSALVGQALIARPELAAADARIAKAELGERLAAIAGKPELTVGLGYTLVDRRTDARPPDNGRDVLGVTGGVSLPIWRNKVAAGVEEAVQTRLAAEAERRSIVTTIEQELDDLLGQLPEVDRRLRLLDEVLTAQAELALESSESAYAAGKVDALALLDAERTLLDVRLATRRAAADRSVIVLLLEGASAAPLTAGGTP